MLSLRKVSHKAPIAFPEARRVVLAAAAPLERETVSLTAAGARVIAQALHAAADIVPYARSAMDGYALRAADTQSARAGTPRVIAVSSTTYAGDMPTSLPSECAIAIATGAALPAGADAVVPFEAVHATSDAITLTSPLAVGQHVFAPGDDAKRGDVLARPGDVVTPGLAGLLASAGFATVAVHRRPRVAIVSTGNEVVGVEDTPARGQIRNSNTAMLVACLERDGAEIVSREHARDAEAQLRTTLQHALEQSDLVITTGGASTGERDLVKGTLRTLGAAFLFDSIALRPARPTGFARVDGRLVATLPGNPAAAYVAYVALVRGVVRRLAGHASPFPATVPARLEGSLHRKDKRHFLMFGALAIRGGAFHVSPLANQCSSLVRTSTDANALIVAEPGSGYSQTGDVVQVEVLDWNSVPITG